MIHPPAPDWQLAEVNVARLTADPASPVVAEFMAALDRINGLSERMEGFVWRHVFGLDPDRDARTSDDPRVIYNASVWQGAAALERFVWDTVHVQFYRRRAEWFDALGAMHLAMWWVPPGTEIDPKDARARLAHIGAHGPSERAFGWAELPGATRWRAVRRDEAVPA
ncbi:DUF3291 domain-containing protein [Jannaschia sp. Os4]|uniref:DUF3291 domain-containing protein n=1 Tax=Jannaschia sp. Os4 TaxID=2807617 RepID=UPI00193A5717|nr:DUF3291 domain-containing protein [Jannaschia sp. Os4]MBM2576711.1 DUF3291 domain-containing protein [Jannaschia sp. Os4]